MVTEYDVMYISIFSYMLIAIKIKIRNNENKIKGLM